jgi:hypothetical protein
VTLDDDENIVLNGTVTFESGYNAETHLSYFGLSNGRIEITPVRGSAAVAVPAPEITASGTLTLVSGVAGALGAVYGVTGFAYSGSGSVITYQWLRDGVAITDAEAAEYTITTLDYSADVSLELTVTNDTGSDSIETASVTIEDAPAVVAVDAEAFHGEKVATNSKALTGYVTTADVPAGSDIVIAVYSRGNSSTVDTGTSLGSSSTGVGNNYVRWVHLFSNMGPSEAFPSTVNISTAGTDMEFVLFYVKGGDLTATVMSTLAEAGSDTASCVFTDYAKLVDEAVLAFGARYNNIAGPTGLVDQVAQGTTNTAVSGGSWVGAAETATVTFTISGAVNSKMASLLRVPPAAA